MNKMSMALLAAALAALVSHSVWASGKSGPRLNAEAMIKACFDKTIGKSAGTTAANREANLQNVLCLEDRIVDQFKVFNPHLRFPSAPDDDRSTVDKVREKLKELRFSVGPLYDWIYNENPGCDPGCGTMYDSIHLFAVSRVLEQMLKDIVAQRLDHGY